MEGSCGDGGTYLLPSLRSDRRIRGRVGGDSESYRGVTLGGTRGDRRYLLGSRERVVEEAEKGRQSSTSRVVGRIPPRPLSGDDSLSLCHRSPLPSVCGTTEVVLYSSPFVTEVVPVL